MSIAKIVFDPQSLTCSICEKLCEKPTMPKCQHVFCKVCIESFTPMICPTCRVPFKAKHLAFSRIHQELIDKIQRAKDEILHVGNPGNIPDQALDADPWSLLLELQLIQDPVELNVLKRVLKANNIAEANEETIINRLLNSIEATQKKKPLNEMQIHILFKFVFSLLQVEGFTYPKSFIKNLISCMPYHPKKKCIELPLDLRIEGFQAFKTLLRSSPIIHKANVYILYFLSGFVELPHFPDELIKEYLSLIDSYAEYFKGDLLNDFVKLEICDSTFLSLVVEIFIRETSKPADSDQDATLLKTRLSSLLYHKHITEEMRLQIRNILSNPVKELELDEIPELTEEELSHYPSMYQSRKNTL